MKSIIQNNKQCFITGATQGLHKHHIFFGTNHNNSEKYGLWVWLKWNYHIADSPHATPHNDKSTDNWLKRIAQRKFEESHSRDDFIRIFGRSWL